MSHAGQVQRSTKAIRDSLVFGVIGGGIAVFLGGLAAFYYAAIGRLSEHSAHQSTSALIAGIGSVTYALLYSSLNPFPAQGINVLLTFVFSWLSIYFGYRTRQKHWSAVLVVGLAFLFSSALSIWLTRGYGAWLRW